MCIRDRYSVEKRNCTLSLTPPPRQVGNNVSTVTYTAPQHPLVVTVPLYTLHCLSLQYLALFISVVVFYVRRTNFPFIKFDAEK